MSSVAIISVPNIFVKIMSPIFTGAFTEVFRIISITSEIISFGTGLGGRQGEDRGRFSVLRGIRKDGYI